MKKEFKLLSIELYNVFNYRKNHKIDFTPRKKGNIFLFDIKNGGGKTSLFLAIKWGFYGNDSGIEFVKDGVKLSNKDFMNQDERSEGRFYVKICFEYDGEYLELRRECPDHGSNATILTLKVKGHMERDDTAREHVAQIIPPDYGDFFMFNGEVLQEIANNQKDLRKTDGVLKLLGLKQLNDLKDLLSGIQKNMSDSFSKSNSIGGRTSDLSSELQRFSEKMERLEKTKKDLNERRDTTINETHQLEEERRRYNDVKGTVDAIQEVNREIRDLQGKRDYAVEYIRNNSANAFLLLIGQDIKSIIGKNDEKKMELKRAASSAGVPSNNYFPIQNDIIAKHLQECPVCKTALSEDAIEHIKTMLRGVSDKAEESKKYNKKQNELDDIQIVLKEHLSGLPKKLNQFCTDLFETNERINENRIKLDNLNKIASNSDIDAIKDLSSRLSKLYEDTSRLDRETFENDNLIKNTEKNLRNVRKELSESTALNDQQAVQTKRMRYLDHLIIRLDSVIKSVSENRRKDILVRADEIFNSITNKPDTYRGLEYDDRTSFSMHIVRNDGQTVLHPSSGEKHVLAISFLVSLSLNTERLSPMMMDTPLSRLDIVHKMNIGRTIASLDNQILFLAQPGEMDDQTRESFEPAVAKMFMSEPTEDNTARITEVEF